MQKGREAEERIRSGDVFGGTSRSTNFDMAAKDSAIEEPSMEIDEAEEASPPRTSNLPDWLLGMRPVSWTAAACQKSVSKGRNCCLFYPLNFCRGLDVINGFCLFHLKAVFNLVYQVEASYQMNDRGRATVVKSSKCFVAEPQTMDDRVTAVFPIFELMDVEPSVEDIKLHHLARYLKAIGMPNWERVYALHVNFLYAMITLRTKIPIGQADQAFNNQLWLHWHNWNEFHSWLLMKYPAVIHLLYSPNGDAVRNVDIGDYTTISQMIVRLFAVSYTSVDGPKFISTPASYGVFVRSHLAFINSMCSVGTTETDSGLRSVGLVATLPYVRVDKVKRSLLHYTAHKHCDDNFCVDSKVDVNAPALNRAVAAACGTATTA